MHGLIWRKEIFQHAITLWGISEEILNSHEWKNKVEMDQVMIYARLFNILISLHCNSCSLLLLHDFYHHIKRYLFLNLCSFPRKTWSWTCSLGNCGLFRIIGAMCCRFHRKLNHAVRLKFILWLSCEITA